MVGQAQVVIVDKSVFFWKQEQSKVACHEEKMAGTLWESNKIYS